MITRNRTIALVALVATSVWFFFTPHLAVRGMKSAAEAKDAAKLGDYVNFPALKESLKGSFTAELASSVSKEMSGSPFGALGAVLAVAMMGPMIDALVTPESLASMMKGEKPQSGKTSTESNSLSADVDSSMTYESFDRFIVTAKRKGATDAPLKLVFLRDGIFSWKLSAIRLQ